MCIRDSERDYRAVPGGAGRVHHSAGDTATSVRPDALCCGCLLYTSDAADERSSVDLGGRRIIKKKKIVRYRAWTTSHTRINYKQRHDEVAVQQM